MVGMNGMVARTALTDEGLAGLVEQILAEDPVIDANLVRVKVTDGVVRLSGVSRSLHEIRRMKELAAQQPAVRASDSLLLVEVTHLPSQEELREEAQTAVASVTSPLEVEVADGTAILRGSVPQPELLDQAILAVEQVPGLKDLRSEVTFTSLASHERDLRPLLEEALRASYPIPGAIHIARLQIGRAHV